MVPDEIERGKDGERKKGQRDDVCMLLVGFLLIERKERERREREGNAW